MYWKKNPDIIYDYGVLTGLRNQLLCVLGFEATEDSSQALLKAFTTERQGWSELKAVENKTSFTLRTTVFHVKYLMRLYSNILAKTFYPEEFADVDPEATLKEFYDKFLPFSYSGIWFMHMN